ncbi:hypothetical protein ASD88_13250 [Pelomonas sp. Root662]|nr:hypothetical protein ASC81_13250 [Pelomonas sp. Root405]KRA72688.1 hypothetical protein ASD88_13250 [Pelomonas sp. Root662]
MLRGKSRFFNKDAKKFLDSLFNILEDLSPNGFFFADAVMELEIGRLLYRARRGNTEEAIQRVSSNAAKELHAPPPAVTPANRMNVEGAPAFYAAFNPDTAIAEVRPSRGSNVVVGCFATTRKLRVIDFTSLKKNAAPAFSIWGDDFVDRSQKRGLLLRLQDRIARPIPLGMEHEYLDTQVVADYLHSYLGFDGAMFESSQKSGGTNIVLFGATLGTYSTESRSFLDAPLLFKENSVEVHEVIEIEIRAKRVR